MFCVNEPFPDGWNRVRILDIKPRQVGTEGLNRDIDEEELKDKEIMIYLQPKKSYQIIVTIMGCEEEEDDEFSMFSNELF